MHFEIKGLDPAPFFSLYGLSDEALAARGARRVTADHAPGYPCRITLEDAPAGERLLLVHHVSHDVATPYRSAYAIYVREGAETAARYVDAIPPVMQARPIALRHFTAEGNLAGASLAQGESALRDAIAAAFAREEIAYLHAHNAAHGCFAAEIRRG